MLSSGGFVLILTFCILSGCLSLQLPTSFKRCKVSPELDGKPNECLAEATKQAARLLAPGIKELGVQPLDPLHIIGMIIEQDSSGPVGIKLRFYNTYLAGLRYMDVLQFKGKLSSPDNFHAKLVAFLPLIEVTGPYTIHGKILFLPVEGKGVSNITFHDTKLHVEIRGTKQIKNNDEYLKVESCKLSVGLPKQLTVHFTNLFNGNKELADYTNQFLNENWKEILTELKPVVEKSFNVVFQDYAKRILERIPFKDIFLLD